MNKENPNDSSSANNGVPLEKAQSLNPFTPSKNCFPPGNPSLPDVNDTNQISSEIYHRGNPKTPPKPKCLTREEWDVLVSLPTYTKTDNGRDHWHKMYQNLCHALNEGITYEQLNESFVYRGNIQLGQWCHQQQIMYDSTQNNPIIRKTLYKEIFVLNKIDFPWGKTTGLPERDVSSIPGTENTDNQKKYSLTSHTSKSNEQNFMNLTNDSLDLNSVVIQDSPLGTEDSANLNKRKEGHDDNTSVYLVPEKKKPRSVSWSSMYKYLLDALNEGLDYDQICRSDFVWKNKHFLGLWCIKQREYFARLERGYRTQFLSLNRTSLLNQLHFPWDDPEEKSQKKFSATATNRKSPTIWRFDSQNVRGDIHELPNGRAKWSKKFPRFLCWTHKGKRHFFTILLPERFEQLRHRLNVKFSSEGSISINTTCITEQVCIQLNIEAMLSKLDVVIEETLRWYEEHLRDAHMTLAYDCGRDIELKFDSNQPIGFTIRNGFVSSKGVRYCMVRACVDPNRDDVEASQIGKMLGIHAKIILQEAILIMKVGDLCRPKSVDAVVKEIDLHKGYPLRFWLRVSPLASYTYRELGVTNVGHK